MVWKNSTAIREKMAELADEAQAILDVAKSENRELEDAERSRIDEIMGVADKPGLLDDWDANATRLEKVEKRRAELAAQKGQPAGQIGDSGKSRITVPASARVAKVKSFRGSAAEENAYKSGQWILATLGKNARSQQWCRDHGISMAMTEGSNSAGGFLVPEEFETAIIDLREEYGVFRREAYVHPMASETTTIPRRASGLTAYFVNENTEITASDAAWDQISLAARKLAALCKYSSELSEDAVISIADNLASEIAYAFAVKEDACGFLGDGTSTYGGVKGLINAIAAGSKVTAATGNTAFSTLDLTDFESMIGKLPMYPGIMPKWYISQAGWAASMMRLQDAAGGNTTANLTAGVTKTFLGYEVVISQSMNSTLTAQTSTSGLCYFGDLRMGAVMGTRRGVSLMTSADRYFELDQLAIKGTERFDINIHGTGTASAAGPIIMLATPSS